MPLTLGADERDSLRAAMRDTQVAARDYYAETARTDDLDALATRVRLFVGAVQVVNDWLQQVGDATSYTGLFDAPRDADAGIVDGFRYARNVTQHVLHPVTPDEPHAMIGGLHGMRVYASWASIPAVAHQRLRPATQVRKSSFDAELEGREVTETMLRALRFFWRVAPDIVARDSRGEWVGFPLRSQPGVAAPLHPEEPADPIAALSWLDSRRPGGDARIVCARVSDDDGVHFGGFTFAEGRTFTPFIETAVKVEEDIAAGYPYLTGDLAAETQDVSALFGGTSMVRAAQRPLADWTLPIELHNIVADFISFGGSQDWRRQVELNEDYLVRRAQRLNAWMPDR